MDSSRRGELCTIPVAKTKALISFAVTAELIFTFGFVYMQIVGFPMQWLIHQENMSVRPF